MSGDPYIGCCYRAINVNIHSKPYQKEVIIIHQSASGMYLSYEVDNSCKAVVDDGFPKTLAAARLAALFVESKFHFVLERELQTKYLKLPCKWRW